MKRLKQYKNKEKAHAYKNRQRKRNYDLGEPKNPKTHKLFNEYEMFLILEHKLTDREIAKKINRTVRSIQIKRWGYKNGTRMKLLKV